MHRLSEKSWNPRPCDDLDVSFAGVEPAESRGTEPAEMRDFRKQNN